MKFSKQQIFYTRSTLRYLHAHSFTKENETEAYWKTSYSQVCLMGLRKKKYRQKRRENINYYVCISFCYFSVSGKPLLCLVLCNKDYHWGEIPYWPFNRQLSAHFIHFRCGNEESNRNVSARNHSSQ